jgi:hypothetical protein
MTATPHAGSGSVDRGGIWVGQCGIPNGPEGNANALISLKVHQKPRYLRLTSVR